MDGQDREFENVFNYGVFKEVSDVGQERISLLLVITRKKKMDETKTLYIGLLVGRGFKEKI